MTCTFTTIQVCEMTGATYRQATYWASTGRIPGQPVKPGSGARRQWTPEQVEVVREVLTANAAGNAGAEVQRLRAALRKACAERDSLRAELGRVAGAVS